MRKFITLLIIISSIYLCLPITYADEKKKEDEDKVELTKDQIAYLKKLESMKLLRLKPKLNEGYIGPDFWAQMDIEQKEAISIAIAVYCGNYKETYLYWAKIYDLMSGKKLARYSKAWGFKVY